MFIKITKLIILTVLLSTTVNTLTIAQENIEKKQIPSHELNYKLPNNYQSEKSNNTREYNYQYTDRLTNKENTNEIIDINYSPQTEYKRLEQEKYKEIENKKALIERKKDQFYDINDTDVNRVSFYLGENQFLRCIQAKYKQLNNNWFSIFYNNQVFFLEQKEMILDYKLTEEQLAIKGGVFGMIKPLEKYSLCFKSNSDYAFDSSKIDTKYMTSYLDDVYFSSKNFSQSHFLIRAIATTEYTQSFDTKPDMINNYDKIINSINSKEKQEENKGNLIEDQLKNDYESLPSQLVFKKDCFGSFYLASKKIKSPYFKKLTLNEDKAEIIALTYNPNDSIDYEIQYDTCHLWGIKKDTITKTGQIKIENIDLKVNKKEISFTDSIINQKNIEGKNEQNIEIEKQLVENGSKIYLTQEISGKIELNLEQYGPVKLDYKANSRPSKIRSLPIFTPSSLFNSIGTGFLDGLNSTKETLLRPYNYFANRNNNTNSFEKDLVNLLGLIVLFSLLITGFLLIILWLIGITKIRLKNSKGLLRTIRILVFAILLIGFFAFFANTFLDNQGKTTPNISTNYSNIIKGKVCSPYGGYYDSSNNFIVNNYLYCLGNLGGIVGLIQDSDQVKEKYYY